MNRLPVLAVILLAACAQRYYTLEDVDAPRTADCPNPTKAKTLALEWQGLLIRGSANFPTEQFKRVDFFVHVQNKTDQMLHLESDTFLVSVNGGPESPLDITTTLDIQYRIPATFPLKGANPFWSGRFDHEGAEVLRVRVPTLFLNGKPTQLPVLTFFKDPPLVC